MTNRRWDDEPITCLVLIFVGAIATGYALWSVIA